MGFLDKLLGKSDVTQVPDLQRALDKLSLPEAEAEVARLERERHALLLDGTDAQVADMDERIAAANRQVERVGAAREALLERIAATQIAEDEASRSRLYSEAKRARDAAVKDLQTLYPKHAQALVELLRTVAAADALVERANEQLPSGDERLVSVEGLARREANRAAYQVSEERFSAWCYPNGTQIHRDDQGTLTPNAVGPHGFWRPFGAEAKEVLVTRREFRRVTTMPEATGRQAPSLASTLNLPGLRPSHCPYWAADQASHPGSILAAIEAAAKKWGRSLGMTFLDEPGPTIQIIPLDAAGPARSAPLAEA